MAWTPTETLLGSHAELENFSHAIQYYTEEAGAVDPVTGLPGSSTQTYYAVRIIPQQENPNTVIFASGITATISGYYKGIFNDTLKTRDADGNFTTVTTLEAGGGVFDKVDRTKVYEVISFKADTTRKRVFTYLAEAYDNNPLSPTYLSTIASQLYTINAQDLNWTPGMISLKELVNASRK